MPWKLIYYEEFGSLSDARRREKQIKAWHSRDSIEKLIEKKGPIVDGQIIALTEHSRPKGRN